MKNMKNLSRRGLALLLALVMCLGMLQVTAFATDGESTESVSEPASSDSGSGSDSDTGSDSSDADNGSSDEADSSTDADNDGGADADSSTDADNGDGDDADSNADADNGGSDEADSSTDTDNGGDADADSSANADNDGGDDADSNTDADNGDDDDADSSTDANNGDGDDADSSTDADNDDGDDADSNIDTDNGDEEADDGDSDAIVDGAPADSNTDADNGDEAGDANDPVVDGDPADSNETGDSSEVETPETSGPPAASEPPADFETSGTPATSEIPADSEDSSIPDTTNSIAGGLLQGVGEALNDALGSLPTAEDPEDVPEDVQAFLDAAAALPETVSPETLEEIMALVAAFDEAYEQLDSAHCDREDVKAALSRMTALMEAFDTLEEPEAGDAVSVASFDELKSAVANAGTEPTTITVTESFDFTGYLWIKEGKDITLTADEGVVLGRAASYTSYLLYVDGKLTLKNVILDSKNVPSTWALLHITQTGDVTMGTGAVIQNSNIAASGQNGGGVYNNGTFTMEGGTISGNTANSGGGVYNWGTFTMSGGTISGNTSGNSGGGVYNGGSFTAEGGIIEDNKATEYRSGYELINGYYEMYVYGGGGGLYSTSTQVTLSGCEISGNENGGIHIDAAYSRSDIALSNLIIVNNKGNIAALYVATNGKVTVENCTITENHSSSHVIFLGASEVTLNNCEISQNTSSGSSRAIIYLERATNIRVEACTIVNNTGDFAGIMCKISNFTTVPQLTLCGGTLIQGNKGTKTGGLHLGGNVVATVDNAVIRGNTGGSDGAGGVYVESLVTFNLENGALYNNSNAAKTAHDFAAHSKFNGNYSLIKASEMTDPDVAADYFSKCDYVWNVAFVGQSSEEVTGTGEISLTAIGRLQREGAYLNGVSGNDDNDGLTHLNPVQSFEKALSVARANNYSVIYVTGGITVAEDAVWNGSLGKGTGNITLMQYSSGAPYSGAMVKVAGGNLTLQNITLDGAVEFGFESSSSLVKITDDGSVTLENGAILENNASKSVGNWFVGGGGVCVDKGTLTMKDGSAIRNNSANYGGGVYVSNNSELVIDGGEISGNTTDRKHKFEKTSNGYTIGGGVFAGYGGSVTMNGGTISNNSAYSGGGISLGSISNDNFVKGSHPSFVMNGGEIDGNYAASNGGGVFVQMNCTATINKGRITNNYCYGYGLGANFGGGGIYVNGGKRDDLVNGLLQLYNVEFTQNSGGAGSVIAGCPTSTTQIHLKNGTVIHNNTRTTSDLYMFSGQVGNYSGTATVYISPFMRGGGAYHWVDKDGNELPLNDGFVQIYDKAFYASTNVAEDKVTGLDNGITTVFEGNYSGKYKNGRGGAIGSNGDVIIGDSGEEMTELTVVKCWEDESYEDERPEFVDVRILAAVERNENGTLKNPVDIGFVRLTKKNQWPIVDEDETKKEQWSTTLENLPKYDENGNEFIYSVKEVVPDGYKAIVDYDEDTRTFTVTNRPVLTVVKNWDDKDYEDGRPNSVDIRILSAVERNENGTLKDPVIIDVVRLTEKNQWPIVDENETVDEDKTKKEQWGTMLEDLPKYDENGNNFIYGVEEVVPDGYEAKVDYDEDTRTFTVTNHPVGELSLTKKVEGQTTQTEFKFAVTVGTETYNFTLKNGETKVLSDLPVGAEYTVKELTGGADSFKITVDSKEVEEAKGQIKTKFEGVTEVVFTNIYDDPSGNPDPETGTLTIHKEVVGGGAAAAEKEYTFTVTADVENAFKEMVPNDAVKVSGNTAIVTITGSGEVTIKGLKAGNYTVKEDKDSAELSGYNLTVTGNDANAAVEADGDAEVTIRNTYKTPGGGGGHRDPDPDPKPPKTPDEQPPEVDVPDRPPVVDIPDEEPPLVDIPDEEPPLVEIPDEEPPLVEIPDEEPPLVEIPDEEPPLVDIPDEEPPLVDIPDVDVPLADVPKTGDSSGVWMMLAVLSAAGLLGLTVLENKKREDME